MANNTSQPPLLSPLEQRLIRASFGKIARKSHEITHTFFNRLQEVNPVLCQKLKCHPTPKNSRLIESIALIVGSISTPDTLSTHIRAVKHQLSAVDIADSDYPELSNIFLWAINHTLKQTFTENIQQAWQTLATIAINTESNTPSQHLDAGAM